MNATRGPLDFDLGKDPFLNALNKQAKESLLNIYLGGLSALTRMLGLDPPEVEIILFDTDKDINRFIKEVDENEGFHVICGAFPQHIQYPFHDKICKLFTVTSFDNSICADIEGIVVDVCSFLVSDLHKGNAFNALDNRVITLSEMGLIHPILFWNAIDLLCYLPGFQFNPLDADPIKMFFLDQSSSDRIERTPSRDNDWQPSFGSRLISLSLIKIANAPYFPFEHLKQYLKYFNLQNFENGIELSLDAYKNYMLNKDFLKIELSPATKIAIIFFPLLPYSLKNPFVKFHSEEYKNFQKINLVQYDKCPLACDILFSIYCLPSSIGFDVVDILHSFFILQTLDTESTLNYGVWAFVDGTKYWKEIISFLEPEKCQEAMNSIIRDKAHILLTSGKNITYSNTELAKANGYQSLYKVDINSLKTNLYHYFIDHPDHTFEDYVAYLETERNLRRRNKY